MKFQELLRADRDRLQQALGHIPAETAQSLLNQIVSGVLHGDGVAKALADGVVLDMLGDACTLDPAARISKWERERVQERQLAMRHLQSVDALNRELRRQQGRAEMFRRGSERFHELHRTDGETRPESGVDALVYNDLHWIASRSSLFWSGIALNDLPPLKRSAAVQKIEDVQEEYGRVSVPEHVRLECARLPAPTHKDLVPRPSRRKKNILALCKTQRDDGPAAAARQTVSHNLFRRRAKKIRVALERVFQKRRAGGNVRPAAPASA